MKKLTDSEILQEHRERGIEQKTTDTLEAYKAGVRAAEERAEQQIDRLKREIKARNNTVIGQTLNNIKL